LPYTEGCPFPLILSGLFNHQARLTFSDFSTSVQNSLICSSE
jgi:hypothetical protein